jgi:conjugative transposon TraK protein
MVIRKIRSQDKPIYMFTQFKNIDSAFKQIRIFSIAFLIVTCILCCYNFYVTSVTVRKLQQRVFILANGKLMEAYASDRKEKIPVEIRDHVKMFHFYFYSIDPDEQVIKRNMTKALYLVDVTGKEEYDNLKESGYYSSFISGNVSQQVEDYDSLKVDIDEQPWYFKYYGKLKIIRTTSIVTRSLITEGFVRTLDASSDNNPHGFLIERWRVLENKDLTIEKR